MVTPEAQKALDQFRNELSIRPGNLTVRSAPAVDGSGVGVEVILGDNNPNTTEGKLHLDPNGQWAVPVNGSTKEVAYEVVPGYTTVFQRPQIDWNTVGFGEAVGYARPFVEKANAIRARQNARLDEVLARDRFCLLPRRLL